MKKIFIPILTITTFTSLGHTETLSLDQVWSKINSQSAAIEASQLQTESLVLTKERASRHWLPKIYIDAKGFQTNNPGNSFVGLLEQRSLTQNDFNPESINHPETHFYTRGALGIDWALYEGNMKSHQVDFIQNSLNAQESMTHQVRLEQYSQVAQSYASIAILIQHKNKIQDLNQKMSSLIKNYQLGQKSNPVGYSGLLGMKSLSNRLTGLINQFNAQINSDYNILKEMGLNNLQWLPVIKDVTTFADQNFFLNQQNLNHSESYKLQAVQKTTQAIESLAHMEKAKFLPRIGAFAESALFKSNRDTADSYIAGIYLQWSLFDSSNYGSLKEADLKHQAMQKNSVAFTQQENAEKIALREALTALQSNLNLLSESEKILIEQTQVTETLFKNGSLSALQFVEVLNRRTDLITQKSEAELNYIKTASQYTKKQPHNLNKSENQ